MAEDCGGCAGQGAHKRWCVTNVGRSASEMGKAGEAAEALGDRVGPNHYEAANLLWRAGSLLQIEARSRALAYIAASVTQEVLGE